MKRDIYQQLLEWKSSPRRKPLLLQGARQTGKTYILKEFGKREYQKCHYFNFEKDPLINSFFERNLDPHRILSELSIYFKTKIQPKEDLIIFDEIQSSNKALNSLKYFEEQANDFHIAAAGSLLGVKMSLPGSFPVGKVNFLQLYPLTFFEFLDALKQSSYREFLENIDHVGNIPQAFHEELISLLRKYYFVGGMPEAVKYHVQTEALTAIQDIHTEIIKSYVLDFAKHAPSSDIPKLSLIWDSIPSHLAKENKKFIFSAVKQGARGREYENALKWLEDAGLVYRICSVENSQLPLKSYANLQCFKIYALDIGLLGALAGVSQDILSRGNQLFDQYHGALTENYVLQQLTQRDKELYYWRSHGSEAEVDFLFEIKGQIYPLEVKAGINPRSKSLRSYNEKFSPDRLFRTTLLNLKEDGKICNIPLYAVSLISNFV